MTAPTATIALIKAHCDGHERSGRAQFSVAGIRLLLDHIASLEAENARLATTIDQRNKLVDRLKEIKCDLHADWSAAETRAAAAEAERDALRAAREADRRDVADHPLPKMLGGAVHDLRNVLKSVLFHFGPEGAKKVTDDALAARALSGKAPKSEDKP